LPIAGRSRERSRVVVTEISDVIVSSLYCGRVFVVLALALYVYVLSFVMVSGRVLLRQWSPLLFVNNFIAWYIREKMARKQVICRLFIHTW